jgi:hypothetical protein
MHVKYSGDVLNSIDDWMFYLQDLFGLKINVLRRALVHHLLTGTHMQICVSIYEYMYMYMYMYEYTYMYICIYIYIHMHKHV